MDIYDYDPYSGVFTFIKILLVIALAWNVIILVLLYKIWKMTNDVNDIKAELISYVRHRLSQHDNYGNNISVYVENGRIVVTGATNYSITNINGAPVNKFQQLPAGVYVVHTAEGIERQVVVS